jgi:formamidopyrimidine-DNA glycosylase
MPELPEVETVARQLDPLVRGQRVKSAQLLDPKLSLPGGRLAGRTITRAFRLGKRVLLELERAGQGALYLAVHLRMTGRLIYVDGARLPAERGEAHLRARFNLERGLLLFYDTRRFGTLELHESLADAAPAGLDPLSPELTPARLGELAAGSAMPVKPWLLRQDKLAGIGNIYACEACFAAGLHPARPMTGLDAGELKLLVRELKRILRSAIKHCGTTFSDFQDARGEAGGYVNYLRVYGRAGQPCPACGTPVARTVQQQRSTFYCPRCQPER